MRDSKPAGNMLWAALFCVAAAVSFNGCGDVSNVSGPPPPVPLSPDALLSTLTVNPGTLDPAFLGDVANYTLDVAFNVASVTVTATPQNASATMKINGQATVSGQARTITLGVAGSSTSVQIVVTAVNGNQNTYIVTVNRAVNNSLQNLTVSPGGLNETFNANTTNYTVNVDSGVNSVTVTATLQDTNATMTINGQATASGQAQTITPLNGPGSNTLVTILVAAPNSSQKTYFVTVIRAALGGNNNLQSLTVSPGPLAPAFTANTTSYTVAVASSVNSVTVTATLQDTNATMTVDGQGTTSGQARTITLNGPGTSTLVTIEVTAPNGNPKTYHITVNQAALGGNNNLQSLTVSPGPLAPAFTANTTSYTVAVASGVGSVSVTATLQDTNATMTVNGQGTTSGQARTITLNGPGTSTLVTIEVTAPNGNVKTYTVTVNRAAIVLSGNNDLSALDVSAGALIETFDAGTTDYTVTAPNTTTDTTVTATVADSTATLKINGSPATSGAPSASIPLVGGTNPPISVLVTAENSATKTYTITITVGP